MEMTERALFWQGVRDSMPTWFGYVSVGLAVGVVGTASHLSVWQVFLMSMFVYAGAAQLIISALLVAGSPVGIIILTTFIVNLRNMLLSLALVPSFAKARWTHRLAIGSLLTDESFGVAHHYKMQGHTLQTWWMHGVNASACVIWLVSCVSGAWIGQWIPDPTRFGLDFALSALFIGLLVFQLTHESAERKRLSYEVILLVAATMWFASYVMPTYASILLATIVGATYGTVRSR